MCCRLTDGICIMECGCGCSPPAAWREAIIEQANDGISIPALGGRGAGALIEARWNELNHDNTKEIAAARMETILEAIKSIIAYEKSGPESPLIGKAFLNIGTQWILRCPGQLPLR